jgi:Spy/CpxP family protein refolding chaperone
MDSLKANKSADRKANMQSRKAIMANTDASLKTVLTAEQQTTYAGFKSKL